MMFALHTYFSFFMVFLLFIVYLWCLRFSTVCPIQFSSMDEDDNYPFSCIVKSENSYCNHCVEYNTLCHER